MSQFKKDQMTGKQVKKAYKNGVGGASGVASRSGGGLSVEIISRRLVLKDNIPKGDLSAFCLTIQNFLRLNQK